MKLILDNIMVAYETTSISSPPNRVEGLILANKHNLYKCLRASSPTYSYKNWTENANYEKVLTNKF